MFVEYGDGKIELTNYYNNVGAIEIVFTGKMVANAYFDDSWVVLSKNNKIICFNMNGKMPELLFDYNGSIIIKSFIITFKDLTKKIIAPRLVNVFNWDLISSHWDKLSIAPEDATGFIKNRIINRNEVRQVNLNTKHDEFYDDKGFPYNGKYHLHGDGQALTGEFFSEDSTYIYRKDRNGNLDRIISSNKKMLFKKQEKYLKDFGSIGQSVKIQAKKTPQTSKVKTKTSKRKPTKKAKSKKAGKY